jgi:group I intron endonuclease
LLGGKLERGFLFMIGIYKITSPTKKVYIGQSLKIEKRWQRYNNLDCKSQPALYNSLKKYSVQKHKFEILCECEINELNEKERYYQDLYSVIKESGLNCVLTETKTKKAYMSDATKLKISLSNKGKKLSEETKQKIRLANLGKKRNNPPTAKMLENQRLKEMPKKKRVVSKETREKLRLANLGVTFTLERRLNISKGLTGKKRSEETKLKLSKNNARHFLGKKLSEETKLKISENNKMKRKVINKNTFVIYNSIKEASIGENIDYTKLRHQITKKNNNTNLIYL